MIKLAAAGLATLSQAGTSAAQQPRQSPQGGALDESTVAQLQADMRSGARTSMSIVQLYLARCDAIDTAGPTINSIIERNPDALAIAEALDRERRDQGERGPLHGIPVLLKDNIDTADKMRTSAGSLALAESFAPRDAHVAARLRAAGCVIMGKTNLSEWANFRGARSTSGWSGRGGQTRNPYALDRNTSGSSSGSGAAIAANLCAIAVGTETDGSIVSPSSVCGLVGFKPTVGLVSRTGIIPIASSQDTEGPMTRSVADAAALLSALAGPDPRDPITATAQGHRHVDYTKFLDPAGLKGARIGVARDFFGVNDRLDRVIADAIAAMKDAGAVVIDPVRIAHLSKLGEPELEVLYFEFKAGLDAYLRDAGAGASVRSMAELIAWNERNAASELQYFGQERLTTAYKKGPLTDPGYRRAVAKCRQYSRTLGIDATLAKHRLDALVAPTGGPAWLTDYINGDHYVTSCSEPPAVSGYPHITVPAGFISGLPVGVSFFASAWSEPALLKLAYAYEQATRMRRPPQFLATAPIV
ncbi:MAG: amidase [Betaproteobacteria bacterium]